MAPTEGNEMGTIERPRVSPAELGAYRAIMDPVAVQELVDRALTSAPDDAALNAAIGQLDSPVVDVGFWVNCDGHAKHMLEMRVADAALRITGDDPELLAETSKTLASYDRDCVEAEWTALRTRRAEALYAGRMNRLSSPAQIKRAVRFKMVTDPLEVKAERYGFEKTGDVLQDVLVASFVVADLERDMRDAKRAATLERIAQRKLEKVTVSTGSATVKSAPPIPQRTTGQHTPRTHSTPATHAASTSSSSDGSSEPSAARGDDDPEPAATPDGDRQHLPLNLAVELGAALEQAVALLAEARREIDSLRASDRETRRELAELAQMVGTLPTSDELRAHDARAASRHYRETHRNSSGTPYGSGPRGPEGVPAVSSTRGPQIPPVDGRRLQVIREQAS